MITDKLRNIGIDIVGDAPWGTHFCQFYKTKQDLIDILVPYFKAGLENNEYCMWITSEPLSEEDAKEALEKAVPNIHNYLEQGQIEILPYTEWYVIEGSFNSDKVLDGWISKLDQALTHGYDGLRLSGNTFWLEKEGWDDFVDYEEAVDNVIGQYRMLALCTYCLDKCTAAEIIDVVNNHEFALTKREGNWDLIENSEHKQKEALIWNQKRNELLIDITSRLLNSEDPQTIIYDICQKTMEFLQCDVFFNYLVNEKKGRLHLNAYGGIPEKDAQKIEWLDYGVAVCGYVALEARRIIEENIFETADERTDHVEAYGVQAYACHPLMVEDKSIGTLSFGTKSRVSFTDRELEVMKAVSDQISIAMSRLISNRALKEAHDNLEEQVEERTQELELASAYNRSLIEASLDPLVTIGRDGKITDINASTEAVTGFNRDDLVGTDFSDYFTEPEKAREGYKQVFREGEVRDYELEIRHKNGQLTPVLYNASAYRDESGEVMGVFAAAHDITERKKAEAEKQKLLENAQQFAEELEVSNEELKATTEELQLTNKELEMASKYNRSLIEASLDPLVTIGPDGKITDVNNSTEAVTGYSRNELIGTDFSDYFTEPQKAREGYQQVFEEGSVHDYPLEIKHKEGSIIPVLYNASVYKDELGKVIGVFAAARDITERKKAEEELRLAYIYNRSLIEASVDPLVTIGPDGKITDVNNSTEEVTGFSRDYLIGTDFSNYFTEPVKAKEGYQQVFEEGSVFDYPLDIKHKDGHITPVLYNASIYRDEDERVIGVFAAARDITEQKKAEKELELASKYNRSLIEASLDPLVTIGPDGKITDVNYSTEAVTGFSRDELIDTDFSDYFTEPEKARKGYQRVFQERMVLHYPLEIKHKNGQVTPVLYNASVYKDESGEVMGVFAAARDITERKKAEEMLKLKIEELARSNAELEQFAYVSSHDLQEPLRMIGSYLQLLQRKYKGELGDEADKYIYFAVDGATRMQNLINDLLAFSRVTTRAKEFELTDSEYVLNQVLSNLEISINENEAIIFHDSLPEVMSDSTQLAQVFQNLISNAIKFRSKKTPKIYISAKGDGNQWLFSVADNGIGIDSKHSERIFEVFKRLHKRKKYPGTGIGLSICKKIVERHGGHIWVESEPDKGSVFYFTLPIKPVKESL